MSCTLLLPVIILGVKWQLSGSELYFSNTEHRWPLYNFFGEVPKSFAYFSTGLLIDLLLSSKSWAVFILCTTSWRYHLYFFRSVSCFHFPYESLSIQRFLLCWCPFCLLLLQCVLWEVMSKDILPNSKSQRLRLYVVYGLMIFFLKKWFLAFICKQSIWKHVISRREDSFNPLLEEQIG